METLSSSCFAHSLYLSLVLIATAVFQIQPIACALLGIMLVITAVAFSLKKNASVARRSGWLAAWQALGILIVVCAIGAFVALA
jgi:uncharacterized membrane protein YecN with MAPEG domain